MTPSRSRLPSASMDLLTEPEIASIKQRTMSQHSILTHAEDLEDQRCPPMFYVWTNRLLIWNCNPVWNRFQSLCHIVCEGTQWSNFFFFESLFCWQVFSFVRAFIRPITRYMEIDTLLLGLVIALIRLKKCQ